MYKYITKKRDKLVSRLLLLNTPQQDLISELALFYGESYFNCQPEKKLKSPSLCFLDKMYITRFSCIFARYGYLNLFALMCVCTNQALYLYH